MTTKEGQPIKITRRALIAGIFGTAVAAACKRAEESMEIFTGSTSTVEPSIIENPKLTEIPTLTDTPTAEASVTSSGTKTATKTKTLTRTKEITKTATETSTNIITPSNTAPTSTETIPPTEVPTTAPTIEIKAVDANILEITPQGCAILELKPEDIEFLAGNEIDHGDNNKQAVALTFDGGSGSQSWPKIREAILKYQVKLNVFLTGDFIRANPAYVQEMAALGLEIGNHSDNHPDFTQISPEKIEREILNCQQALDEAIGYHLPMRFFRFPYGARNKQAMADVARYGLQSVYWSNGGDSGGWDNVGEKEVERRLNAGMRPGQIFVQHIGSADDASSLDKYLQKLSENSYQVLPISGIVSEADKPPSIISAEKKLPGMPLAFNLPNYNYQTSVSEPSERETKDYLVFLNELQQKVDKKRGARAEKDPAYFNRIDTELNKNRITFLLLGLDLQNLADVPLLVTINSQTGRADLLRIPRDLHAPEVDDLSSKYRGYPYRINAITAFGELDDARRVFEDATGLSQDFCLSVDFDTFKEVIDILGGVPVNVDPFFVERYQQEINDWLDGGVKAGWQYFMGKMALNYVRWRKKDGDNARGDRQMQIIEAIANRAILRIKEDPIMAAKLARWLVGNKKIGYDSEFSLLDFASLADNLRNLSMGAVTSDFNLHSPWGKLVYTPWSESVEEDGMHYTERYQQFLVGSPLEDPENVLDYWQPLRQWVASNFV